MKLVALCIISLWKASTEAKTNCHLTAVKVQKDPFATFVS